VATWSGWQDQFLNAAGANTTSTNEQFLTDWAAHANSPNCKRNPNDLHAKVGGSTNCVKPAGFTWWTQNYTTHAHAATAFGQQLSQTEFAAISDTLGYGDPYQDPGYKLVTSQLRKWGSTNFAGWYLVQAEKQVTGSGGQPANIHKSWHDLRNTLNKRMPGDLKASAKMSGAALQDMQRARKVRTR
jgi:hypothetical protein